MERTLIRINANSRYEHEREEYPVYKYMKVEENCRLTGSIDTLLRDSITEGCEARSYLAEVIIPVRQYFELLKRDNDLIFVDEEDITDDDIVLDENVYLRLHSWNITFDNVTDGYTVSIVKEE